MKCPACGDYTVPWVPDSMDPRGDDHAKNFFKACCPGCGWLGIALKRG